MGDPFRGRRFTVMGLGTRGGGVGVAAFLAGRGAVVTVTDQRTEEQLAEPMSQLAHLPIRYVLGRHEAEDFTAAGTDVVVRNPGVRRNSPFLAMARESGVAVEMEMSLFLRACPAPVIGITGTKGKTTTAALCASMLRAWDPRTVVAGNMGVSALGLLDQIEADTPVVLEVSSWQLEALDEHQIGPHVAVITNISEDHLDSYDGFDDYAETKRSIGRHQSPGDFLLLNRDDPEAMLAAPSARSRIVPFGLTLDDRDVLGVGFDGSRLIIRDGTAEDRVELPDGWNASQRGEHAMLNLAAAAGAARLRGATASAIRTGLQRFEGVRDRDELVATVDGVRYINDTSATAPVAVRAAVQRYRDSVIHLIAGGSDKQLDLQPLVKALSHAATVHLLRGAGTDRLLPLLQDASVDVAGIHGSMNDAVSAAAESARSGDIVLLSPGCASFGIFRDEFDRGNQFREAVAALTVGTAVR